MMIGDGLDERNKRYPIQEEYEMKDVKNTRDYRQQTVKMDLQVTLEKYVREKADEYLSADEDRRTSIDERVSDFIRLVFKDDKTSALHTRYYTLYNEMKGGVN